MKVIIIIRRNILCIFLGVLMVTSCGKKYQNRYERCTWDMRNIEILIESCESDYKTYPRTIMSAKFCRDNGLAYVIPNSMPFFDPKDDHIAKIISTNKYVNIPGMDVYSPDERMPYVVYYFGNRSYIVSAGPDRKYDIPNDGIFEMQDDFNNYRSAHAYDPTNGIRSEGDIIFAP